MQTVPPATGWPAPSLSEPRITGWTLEVTTALSLSWPPRSAPPSRSAASVPPDPGHELSTFTTRRTHDEERLPPASVEQMTTSFGPFVQPGSLWVSMESCWLDELGQGLSAVYWPA